MPAPIDPIVLASFPALAASLASAGLLANPAGPCVTLGLDLSTPSDPTADPEFASTATADQIGAVNRAIAAWNWGALPAAQAAKLAALDTWVAGQLAAGFAFAVNGTAYTFPLDPASQTKWHVLLTLTSSLTFPIQVVNNAGTATVSMDQPTATACAQAALAAGFQIDQQYAGYVAQISAATTPAQLAAIAFS